MKLIVGLGNPGPEYTGTRHSAGFIVVEALGQRHGVKWQTPRGGRASHASWQAGDERVQLVRPQTMMNLSGAVFTDDVRAESAPGQILIVCDDVNIPLGTLRMRAQGGAGGHNGLESCLAALGTDEVPRLRVGVGIPALPKDLTDFVLSPFHNDERPVVDEMVARAVEACELWVQEGIETAMNKVNGPPTSL